MESKKMVTGDFIDPETKLRFVEDIRGNLHCVMTMENTNTSGDINITVPEIKIPDIIIPSQPAPNITITPDIEVLVNLGEEKDKQIIRCKRILEALRVENNWLWYILETAIIDGKKNPKNALVNLEKAVKDRKRI